MSYIFLTKKDNYDQDERGPVYYAIDADELVRMNVADTYDRYGQQVGAYDAGDYDLDNSASDAKTDCENAIAEKFNVTNPYIIDGEISSFSGIEADDFEGNFMNPGDEGEEEYNKTLALIIEINEFIQAWREENEVQNECTGFTYWDGHNWQTIITDYDAGPDQLEWEVVNDELAAELNKAIEDAEFVKEGFGERISYANGYAVKNSWIQGTWESYSVWACEKEELEEA